MVVQKWIDRYPHISSALEQTTAVVARLRANPEAELEVRLGSWRPDDSKFVPGVSRAHIDRVIDMMQGSRHLEGDADWVEEQDFFFEQDGVQYRTRVSYDNTTMQIVPTTIRKEQLETATFVALARNSALGTDLRVSLKHEIKVLRTNPCVQTSLVRIKQRRRFVTIDKKWAYDFTMSWSGATKTKAEACQSSCDPVFEVECELLDAPAALAEKDDARLAASLLLKGCDLLPSESVALRAIA